MWLLKGSVVGILQPQSDGLSERVCIVRNTEAATASSHHSYKLSSTLIRLSKRETGLVKWGSLEECTKR